LKLDELRAQTPGTKERVHLNNAGAALMPSPVIDAVRAHLELEARIGGYEAADAREADVEAAYRAVAELIGAAPRNVALVDSATSAFMQALSSLRLGSGDLLLTTRNDYVSNQIQYLSLASRTGIEVIRAPDRPEGGVDPEAMEALIARRRPGAVAVTHVPTSSGLVQEVEAIGAVCRRWEIPYLVDACQSVGQLPVDAVRIGCDYLAATGRKFLRAPRGTGFLYVSDRMLERGAAPLFPDLRGAEWVDPDRYRLSEDARRFETWEFPWALVLGLGAASRYLLALGVDAARNRIRCLARILRSELGDVPGVRVLDRGPELCGIVAVAVAGRSASELRDRLRGVGINTSVIARSSAVLDLEEKGVEEALRVSPHYYNTEDELFRFLDTFRALLP